MGFGMDPFSTLLEFIGKPSIVVTAGVHNVREFYSHL